MIDFDELKEKVLSGRVGEVIELVKFNSDSLKALSNVFFILSLCLRYPDEEVYSKIEELLPHFKEFFEEYCDKLPVLIEKDDMEAEYVRLFVSNYGGVIAVPYASPYLEEEGLLMGESTVRLRDLMENEGIMLKDDIKEVVDHIYILLELCSTLLNKIIDKNKIDGDSIATFKTFLTVIYDYILNFYDKFADKVIEGTSVDFYRDVSTALKNFFKEIDEILEDVFLYDERLEEA